MLSRTSSAHQEVAIATTQEPTPRKLRSRKTIIAILAGAIALIFVGVFLTKRWPFSQTSVISDLAKASDCVVTTRGFHPTYFPPGAVLKDVEFRHGSRQFRLITIEKLTIAGSYRGILTSHVPRITAEGARVFIPPFGSNVIFHSKHSTTVVDEIVANGATVEFKSADPHQQSLRFDLHQALLTGVRWGSPIHYLLKFHNPDPPGEISVKGDFGAWADGHPQDTPLSGEYSLDQADLGAYGGIAGLLASHGQFNGVFKHISVSGQTDTPDFEVKSSGHKVRLRTTFDAFVNAMQGDTFLNRGEAHFGHTTVISDGSIAGSKTGRGKEALLRLTVRNGRIEDILGLFVSEPHPPMSGPVSFSARAAIPSDDEPFLEKVTLRGAFGIDAGHFSKPETQKDVDQLSAGARGQKKEDPETVLSDLDGEVRLTRGVARFSDLKFGVPGAKARLQGTYNIVNYRIDLHGHMRVDTRISNTSSGVKAPFPQSYGAVFQKEEKG